MRQYLRSSRIGRLLTLPALALMMLTTGCLGGAVTHDTVILTPNFPTPEQGVVTKIQSLGDPAVDRWMIELFKLCQKLEKEC